MHSNLPRHLRRIAFAGISAGKVWNSSMFFPGTVSSQWVFIYRKWSTGSMPSGQPGSTTYRWPSPGPVMRRWGGHGGFRWTCCRGNPRWFCWNCNGLFFKSPILLKGRHTSVFLDAFISDSFLFFSSCSWCLNSLETSWRKALWRKQVQRFAAWFCLEEPSVIKFSFSDLNINMVIIPLNFKLLMAPPVYDIKAGVWYALCIIKIYFL